MGGTWKEDQTTLVDATLALVGFHIAGLAGSHAELIWASFEHMDNVPDWKDFGSDGSPNAKATGQKWSFYDGKSSRPTGKPWSKAPSLTGNTLKATNIFRENPIGDTADPPTNFAEFNGNVQAQLKSHKSVWQNYRLIGAIWAVVPSEPIGSVLQLGSETLANVTMESFTQDQNCFHCHVGGRQKEYPTGSGNKVTEPWIYLSKIFEQKYPLSDLHPVASHKSQ